MDIQLSGENFSPKTLRDLTNLPIIIIVESGEIAKIGRYKGNPSPNGIGIIEVSNNTELNEVLEILKRNQGAVSVSNLSEVGVDFEPINGWKN